MPILAIGGGTVKLEDIKLSTTLSFEEIASDRSLSTEIQQILIDLKLLCGPADGKFGTLSRGALSQFNQIFRLNADFLAYATAQALLLKTLPTLDLDLSKRDFAARIATYMQSKHYLLEAGLGQFNIIYVEGINADGTPPQSLHLGRPQDRAALNNDAANEWNDLRLVMKITNGIPKIITSWKATTEPGDKYTFAPLNPDGAFRIAFGQYRAWRVGDHKGHEALVQCGEITGYRDKNKDGLRTGDRLFCGGDFGVNQHAGGNSEAVGGWSAGCLVGQSTEGHSEFMKLIKSDVRYQFNNNFVFLTTIIPGDKL